MNTQSRFTGGMFGLLGIYLLMILLTVFTLGIGTAWAVCIRERWMAKHTQIEGRQLKFVGGGLSLFIRYILWGLLGILIWVGLIIAFAFMVLGGFGDLTNLDDLENLMSGAITMLLVWILIVFVVNLFYYLFITIAFTKWRVRYTKFQ